MLELVKYQKRDVPKAAGAEYEVLSSTQIQQLEKNRHGGLGKYVETINHHMFLQNENSFLKYIKYNYFSKNIVREGKARIIPYKNAILDLSRESRIYIKGKNVEIGINKLKGSKAETHIRMRGNAKWYANNGCGLFYNTVLEIKDNAVFESGFFTANGGSVIICAKHICFGEDVMMGRNVIVYDSDHHQVLDEHYNMCNPSKDVIIEDHVWLTTDITVLKGVTIGRDSLITAMTLVRKDVPPYSLVGGGSTGNVVSDCNGWSRRSVHDMENADAKQ